MSEEENVDGQFVIKNSVKVSKYLDLWNQTGTGMVGQPKPHYYFHRPLHVLLSTFFHAGLVMDGIEEPTFHHPEDGSKLGSQALTWTNYTQIPPVLAVRMRVRP